MFDTVNFGQGRVIRLLTLHQVRGVKSKLEGLFMRLKYLGVSPRETPKSIGANGTSNEIDNGFPQRGLA